MKRRLIGWARWIAWRTPPWRAWASYRRIKRDVDIGKDNTAAVAIGVAEAQAAAAPPRARGGSRLCTQADLASPEYAAACAALGERRKWHRKQWEFAFILQAVEAAGLATPGRRGLGFGVGREPLTACFAARGCEIVATDLARERAAAAGWVDTGQHADALRDLERPALCAPADFAARVSFRHVDMNAIPAGLDGFDFCWSACSLEHLGSLAAGARFVAESLRCLRPGGIAVHTTEFNLSSDDRTVDHEGTVLYRRQDIERLVADLRAAGHHVDPVDYDRGEGVLDRYVDTPPFREQPHLRLLIGRFACTSIGLIARRGP